MWYVDNIWYTGASRREIVNRETDTAAGFAAIA